MFPVHIIRLLCQPYKLASKINKTGGTEEDSKARIQKAPIVASKINKTGGTEEDSKAESKKHELPFSFWVKSGNKN